VRLRASTWPQLGIDMRLASTTRHKCVTIAISLHQGPRCPADRPFTMKTIEESANVTDELRAPVVSDCRWPEGAGRVHRHLPQQAAHPAAGRAHQPPGHAGALTLKPKHRASAVCTRMPTLHSVGGAHHSMGSWGRRVCWPQLLWLRLAADAHSQLSMCISNDSG
jgi:hypothetical protein